MLSKEVGLDVILVAENPPLPRKGYPWFSGARALARHNSRYLELFASLGDRAK